MKRAKPILILLIGLLRAGGAQAEDLKSMDFLLGCWNFTNEHIEKNLSWKKNSDQSLIGKAEEFKEGSLVFTENLELGLKDNQVFYAVTADGIPREEYFYKKQNKAKHKKILNFVHTETAAKKQITYSIRHTKKPVLEMLIKNTDEKQGSETTNFKFRKVDCPKGT